MRQQATAQQGWALDGVLAGVVGTVAMDLVTWKLYRKESAKAYRQEKRAQVDGKYVAHVAARKAARLAGKQLEGRRLYAAGKLVHFLFGIGPALAYGALRRRFPWVRAGGGLLYGLGVYLFLDELVAPLLGLASGPTRYPWQAHARGLAGHLTLGATLEATFQALAEEKRLAAQG